MYISHAQLHIIIRIAFTLTYYTQVFLETERKAPIALAKCLRGNQIGRR